VPATPCRPRHAGRAEPAGPSLALRARRVERAAAGEPSRLARGAPHAPRPLGTPPGRRAHRPTWRPRRGAARLGRKRPRQRLGGRLHDVLRGRFGYHHQALNRPRAEPPRARRVGHPLATPPARARHGSPAARPLRRTTDPGPWRRCGRVVEDPWRNGARTVESLLVGCGQTLGSRGDTTSFSTVVHGAAGLGASRVDNHPPPSTRIHRGSTVPSARATGRAQPLVPSNTGLGAATRAVLHAGRGSLLLRRRRNNAPAAPLTSAARERPEDTGQASRPQHNPPTSRPSGSRTAHASRTGARPRPQGRVGAGALVPHGQRPIP